jgi:hypothetical protein
MNDPLDRACPKEPSERKTSSPPLSPPLPACRSFSAGRSDPPFLDKVGNERCDQGSQSEFLGQALTWTLHTPRPLAQAPAQQNSAGSAMFIARASGEPQAPLGAACCAETATSRHMPLLTELEKGSVGRRSYKHGAPNGAFADGGNCATPCQNLLFWKMPRPRITRMARMKQIRVILVIRGQFLWVAALPRWEILGLRAIPVGNSTDLLCPGGATREARRACFRRQRRHSYQPRATPWVYRPKTILSAESATHCAEGLRPGDVHLSGSDPMNLMTQAAGLSNVRADGNEQMSAYNNP